jgi:hypothetical protein
MQQKNLNNFLFDKAPFVGTKIMIRLLTLSFGFIILKKDSFN